MVGTADVNSLEYYACYGVLPLSSGHLYWTGVKSIEALDDKTRKPPMHHLFWTYVRGGLSIRVSRLTRALAHWVLLHLH